MLVIYTTASSDNLDEPIILFDDFAAKVGVSKLTAHVANLRVVTT